MARIARIVLPGHPHHITQRGNRRMPVFFNEEDRQAYLSQVSQSCRHHGVDIWAWCLMTNHVHCIAVPEKEDSLARCFADAHAKYARRINKREGWTGHLWQERFGSSVLDEPHLILAVRYVERNPVRAGIVRVPWEYHWSSAAWHMGKKIEDPLVRNDRILINLIKDWEGFLLEEDEQGLLERIRREAHVSRPVGTELFIQKLERRCGRSIVRKKPGRPYKEGKKSVTVPN